MKLYYLFSFDTKNPYEDNGDAKPTIKVNDGYIFIDREEAMQFYYNNCLWQNKQHWFLAISSFNIIDIEYNRPTNLKMIILAEKDAAGRHLGTSYHVMVNKNISYESMEDKYKHFWFFNPVKFKRG